MDVSPPRPVLRTDAMPEQAVRGLAVIGLAAGAYLGVAFAFAFIDRNYGRFGFEALLWLVWAALGFGVRILAPERPGLRSRVSIGMLVVTGLIWIVPAFLAFNLVRWAAVGLLLLMAGRAPMLRTRRDLYYLLAVLIAVALLILTHERAQWPVWFYLGPAWLCIGLVLAWDYAAGLPVKGWMKAVGTGLFLVACILVTTLVIAALPRPSVLGFGFLPPGTTTPGRFRTELPKGPGPRREDGWQLGGNQLAGSGKGDRAPGQGEGRRQGGDPGHGQGQGQDQERGQGQGQGQEQGRGGSHDNAAPGIADGIAQALAQALQDRNLPGWQREAIRAMRDGWGAMTGRGAGGPGQSTPAAGRPGAGRPGTGEPRNGPPNAAGMPGAGPPPMPDPSFWDWLLLWLALVLLGILLWRRRWRIATESALGVAALLQPIAPARSLRWSMRALGCLLRGRGHGARPGMSLAEWMESAPGMPQRVRNWLGGAVRLYGEWRFGHQPARPERAAHVRAAVTAAAEVLAHPPPGMLEEKTR